MAEEKAKKASYLGHLIEFYFAPEFRSIATLLFLGIFGYLTLYYVDSVLLAIKYLWYITFGNTALLGITHLFIGMLFIISLVLPFFISLYSIFVLHRMWDKPEWAIYVKWLMTFVMIIGGIIIIIGCDKLARFSAEQEVLQSFIEDANISGRI